MAFVLFMCIFKKAPSQEIMNEVIEKLPKDDAEELPISEKGTNLMENNVNSVDEIKEEKRNVENENTDKVAFCLKIKELLTLFKKIIYLMQKLKLLR